MKKYVSIIAIVLCAFVSTQAMISATPKSNDHTSCACCKNCKDDQCKALCAKWSALTAEEQKSPAGQKVKEECTKICKEKKCCSSDGQSSSCESMTTGKSCCKK